MKRWICTFTALALLLSLCFITAAAGDGQVTEYELYLFGRQVTSANQADIFGDGTASFDPASNVLTLNNPSRSGNIRNSSGKTFKITSYGLSLTVRGSYHMPEADSSYGLAALNGSLTLDGSFTFLGEECGIYAGNDLTASGNISAEGGSFGVYTAQGGLNLDGSFTFRGTDCGIYAGNGFTASGNVSAASDNVAVVVVQGSMTLESGFFSASGSSLGVNVKNGGLSISPEMESVYFRGDTKGAIYTYWVLGPFPEEIRMTAPANGYLKGHTVYDPNYIPPDAGPVYVPIGGEDEWARVVRLGNDTPYGFAIGDIRVTSSNAGDILGNGRAAYDPFTKTLTLNDPDLFYSSATASVDGSDATAMILVDGIDRLTVKGEWDIPIFQPSPRTNYAILSTGTLDFDGSFKLRGSIAGVRAAGIVVSSGSLQTYGKEIGAVAGTFEIESGCAFAELESDNLEPGLFDTAPAWPADYFLTDGFAAFRNDQAVSTAHYHANNKYAVRRAIPGESTLLKASKVRITNVTGFEGAGSESDPFRISSEGDWVLLASLVDQGSPGISGRHFALMNDLSVTTMVGTSVSPFNGIFDGRGQTLTFTCTAGAAYCAPFRYIGTAEIRNLRTAGSVSTAYKYAAGLAGDVSGSCSIVNCVSSVEIRSGVSGDGTHGGLVATASNVSLTGCLFNGSISGADTTKCAGFVGWDRGGSSVSDCVFDGTVTTKAETATFIRNSSMADRCYYARAIGQGRDYGKMLHTVSVPSGTPATVSFVEGVTYNVSGITACAAGIRYMNLLQAGVGDQVPVRLAYGTLPPGTWLERPYASPGELTAAADGTWILAMPDEDVQIRLLLIPDKGSGTQADPYRIESEGDWDLFSYAAINGFSTSGKYFSLTKNISVTAMMGTQANPFAGIFDGNGKTLSFNADHTDSSAPAAPFAWTRGAVIRNLHVDGTVTGHADRASGLIGENTGAVSEVFNCRVSVSLSGASEIGGFLVNEGPGVRFSGCLFDGRIVARSGAACFAAGSRPHTGLSFIDCLAAPAALTGGSAVFCGNGQGGAPALSNCYSLASAATAQGRQAFDVTADEGVTLDFGEPAKSYSVSGLSAYVPGLRYEGYFYAGAGEIVSLGLSCNVPSGCALAGFACGAGTLAEGGTGWTLIMPGGDVRISPVLIPDSGSGTPSDPYRITAAGVWNMFTAAVENGFSTSGKYFTLENSVTVTTMIGTQENPFAGVFDGNGKTLSFRAVNTDSSSPAAPFAWTGGAVIRNLRVTGSVTGSAGPASGLIGANTGAVSEVTDCRVSVSLSGASDLGGFLVSEGPGVYFSGCLFDGRLDGGSGSACFAAGSQAHTGLSFIDCLAAPASFTGGGAFFCGEVPAGTQALSNCYFLTPAAAAQGRQAFSVTAAEGITLDFGTPAAAYDVSGLSAYAAGLLYDGVFYAGAGETVPLSLSCSVPSGSTFLGFESSTGTLAETETGWALTLSGGDAVIRALVVTVPAFGTPDLVLPASLTEIQAETFEGAGMKAVLVPAQVTSIGARAFRNCARLERIRIPAGCTLGENVFEGCGLVFVYSAAGSPAEAYCSDPAHSNCVFVQE